MGMENIVRDRLERGESVFGVRLRSFSTTLLQVLGQVDVEYGYLDLEHAGFSPYDSTSLENMQMSAENVGISLVVRLPAAEPSMVRKVLDAGIRTIIVPRVETAKEVKRVVCASRYTYDEGPGKRGFGTSMTNDWGVRPDGYTEREDNSVLVGIMLETKSAVENLQKIVSTPELGFVKIGAGDLSVSLGHPQEYENPKVQDAIEKVEQVCVKNDVPLGRGVSSVESARKAMNNGYTLIDIGGDVEILRSMLKKRVDELNKAQDIESV